MPHIVTAVFEDFANAQRALEALMEAGVTPDRISLVGTNPGREVSSISGFRELSAGDDVLAQLHDLPLPAEDRRLFEQMVARGYALVAARVDWNQVEEAARILEMFNPIDLDRESMQRAAEGGRPSEGVDVGEPLGAALGTGVSAGVTDAEALPGAEAMAERPDDVGASELRADDAQSGAESTAPVDDRRIEERAAEPGVLALDQRPDPRIAAKLAPAVDPRTDEEPDIYWRETARLGRVRSYARR